MNKLTPLIEKIHELYKRGAINEKTYNIMKVFVKNYVETGVKGGSSEEKMIKIFEEYLGHLEYLHKHPFSFEPYHEQILEPINYHQFGQDFVEPLVDLKNSRCLGEENVEEIQKAISSGRNVILLANHQTEVDPQLIEFLLEKKYPKLGQEMIFVAGDRVILDHLAVPVSMGRNLLCIYSKKHINNPPEEMEKKRLHNKKTMQLMSELLKEGGKCIYVAPSGGRDRPDKSGHFPVAPLDPQSIEMFYVMAKLAKTPTDFYTLALLTHKVLPPPNDVGVELGEDRQTTYSGVYGYFGKKIDMLGFSKEPISNKIERRHKRSDTIWNQIHNDYQQLLKLQDSYES